MDTRHAVLALESEVGEGMVARAPAGAPAVGGRRPELLLAPQSAAEVGIAVAAAARLGLAVAPVGGGTALGALAPPVRPYVGLLTRGLTGIVEHAADDLTITARAGTTVADFRAVLAMAKQRLTVDVPLAERATLGGMIAVSPSGPLRFGHGTLRDYLLGITVVDAAGRQVRAGGRVVKNVAGYDLMKLHAGARGTLGVVVEATFKVKPIPECFEWMVVSASPSAAESVRLGLAAAQVPAAALELVSAELAGVLGARAWSPGVPATGDARFLLAVGIEGVEAEVRWQEERVREVLASAGTGEPVIVNGSEAHEFLRRIVDFGAAGGEELLVRAAVLPSRLPELVAAWSAVLPELPEAPLAAEVGTGVVRLRVPAASPGALAALHAAARRLGGHAVIDAIPPGLRGEIDSWEAEALPLAARLKDALDPESVFLPGSYLGLGSGPGVAAAV